MIASKLKKLAVQHNLNISKGVSYGNMLGYAVTLSEGAGYKLIQISTTFPEPQKQLDLLNVCNERDLKSEFRVTNLLINPKGIQIVFHDNPGTMKKIYAFIDYFFPLLKEYGATPYNICTECHCEITSGHWKLIDTVAYYLHDSCAEKIQRTIDSNSEMKKKEDTGSYITGFIGSLLGASLGALLWAILLSFGYIASVIGFVIGWLAEKGYTLLRGKNGKGKLFILIISIIFGVLLGTVGGEAISLVRMIINGELSGYTLGDIPILILFLLIDAEYISAVLGNVVLGFVFALLGVFSLLRRTNKEVSEKKIINLD